MDLSQEVDPGEMPRTVARVAARESRHGLIRRVSLDEDDGRLVYTICGLTAFKLFPTRTPAA
jgi:hypothetical protein